ncbi:MAG: molybdenum ABC transporter ATP-binding protein [Hellea sp.]
MSDRLNLNMKKALGGFTVDVKQSLPLDGITALFGPSGAGKSSLLKLIAGFETPDNGHLSLRDKTWFDSADKINVPPYKRAVGYMFQDGRLFPHMSVRQNLEFAAKRADKKIPIDQVITAFDLTDLTAHSPLTLSGGERRRAALARTVLTAPDVLLLDEPLTGLDRARKREILPFVESLHEDFNIPCIYVTHDIEEVSRLADKVMVMSGGQISAFGDTVDILSHLDATPLQKDYDISSLFEGRITGRDKEFCLLQVNIRGAEISLPEINGAAIGQNIRLRIRASDVAIAAVRPKGVSIRNVIQGEISEIVADKHAAYAVVTLQFQGQFQGQFKSAELRSRITRASCSDLNLQTGMSVYALIKSVSFEGHL